MKNHPHIKEFMNTSAPLCIQSYIMDQPPVIVKRKNQSGTRIHRMQTNAKQVTMKIPIRTQAKTSKSNMLSMTTVIQNNQQSQEDIKQNYAHISHQHTTLQQQNNPHSQQHQNKALAQSQNSNNTHQALSKNPTFYSAKQSFKYNENDGFMRGARIAEKIQEFYHHNKSNEKPTSINQSQSFTASRQLSRAQNSQTINKPRAVSAYGNHRRVALHYQPQPQSQNLAVDSKELYDQTLRQQNLQQATAIQKSQPRQNQIIKPSQIQFNNNQAKQQFNNFVGFQNTTDSMKPVLDIQTQPKDQKIPLHHFHRPQSQGFVGTRKRNSVDQRKNADPSVVFGTISKLQSNIQNKNNTMIIEDHTSAQKYQFQNKGSKFNETMKISDIISSQDHTGATLEDKNILSNQTLQNYEDPQSFNQNQLSNNEIRKIKLNYIQLNKRAGTSYAIKRQNQPLPNATQVLAQKDKINQEAKNEYTNHINPNSNLIFQQQNIDTNQLMEKLFYNDLIKDDKPQQQQQQQQQQQPKSSEIQTQIVQKHRENSQNLESELYDMQFCTENSTSDNLDNYIIGKRIGQGAYAVVRIGLHKELNSKIACKIYEKFKLLEPNRRKSVKREIKIMEKLDHKHIAKLYEAFDTHKQVFLIMEFVNGGSLHGYLKSKPNRQMNESEAKFLFKQVVQAIHYCHQRNITHRDVKLENILLNEQKNQVKLIDFGFSTCIPNDKKIRLFCGTPSYMAPEIVSKKEYTGPPADIWALGVLFFALLCGRFPFKGANDKELYKKICKSDIEVPEHVSLQARNFIYRIFKKDPEQRPSTKQLLQDYFLSNAEIEFEAFQQNSDNSFRNQPVPFQVSGRTTKMINNLNQTAELMNISQIDLENSIDKDKKVTSEQLKQFIADQNKKRVLLQQIQQKDQLINITSVASSFDASSKQQVNESFQKKNKINMEAYQAYYNTNEQQTHSSNYSLSQSHNNLKNQFGQEQFPQNMKPGQQTQNLNIINNIMHINYGANINITTQPNCQNNFIFNNTAPINLNLYDKNANSDVLKTIQKPDLKPKNISNSNDYAEVINYDQDIIRMLTMYGYSEKEVIIGLRDTNSQVSAIYQKLIDEKLQQQIGNTITQTHKEMQIQSLASSMRTKMQENQAKNEHIAQRAQSHSIGRVNQTKQQQIGITKQQPEIEDFGFSDSVENQRKKLATKSNIK